MTSVLSQITEEDLPTIATATDRILNETKDGITDAEARVLIPYFESQGIHDSDSGADIHLGIRLGLHLAYERQARNGNG